MPLRLLASRKMCSLLSPTQNQPLQPTNTFPTTASPTIQSSNTDLSNSFVNTEETEESGVVVQDQIKSENNEIIHSR